MLMSLRLPATAASGIGRRPRLLLQCAAHEYAARIVVLWPTAAWYGGSAWCVPQQNAGDADASGIATAYAIRT